MASRHRGAPAKGRPVNGRPVNGQPVNGWIVLDKSAGMTSARAVGRAKRLLNAAKAGHAGTLDPMATGVLPIAFGEATKVMPYAMDGEKVYRFTARWGEARTTDDSEGEITEISPVRPSADQILTALPRFIGDIQQRPPAYSAIKIKGRRAYDLARAGQSVKLQERTVSIARLELIPPAPGKEANPDTAEFEMLCGKGTYVRALVRDLGQCLGTCGHLSALRRIRVGPFAESQAICLDKLEVMVHSAPLHAYLLPITTVLDDIPAVAVTGPEASRLRCGQAVRVPSSKEGTVCVMAEGAPVALAQIAGGELRPVRVFNL